VRRLRAWDSLLGLNGRNAYIARQNSPASIRLVNDKFATKQALTAAGVATVESLLRVTSGRELRQLQPDLLPAQWACKPNQGLGGTGILLAAGRCSRGWHTFSGRQMSPREVQDHVRLTLDGEFSNRPKDTALFEPLLVAHPDLARLSYRGLPDVRVICDGDDPRLAMLRLPTSASGGRANLHQKAVGAAVDIETGRVAAAMCNGSSITRHPDTGTPLLGAEVPFWPTILSMASRCSGATGLCYVGADIVIDVDRGPLVLEVNARPGLQIQNITGRGLRDALAISTATR
jgi:alpha-L-glutamate ligase-like protein